MGQHCVAAIGRGDDVFHSYGSNQALIIGDRATLVYDTGFSTRVPNLLLKRIGRANAKSMIVVNSHYHSDHVFGNCVFAGIGASVIAHEKCSRRMERDSSKLLETYRHRDDRVARMLRDVRVTTPDIIYEHTIETKLGNGVRAEVVHPEASAHTDGDSIVWSPTERVVFAGDVLWVGYHPNLEDADIQGQVQALRLILKMKPSRIVPGHGPVSGPRDVKRSIKYLEQLSRNIRGGLRRNLKEEDFVRHVIPPWSWSWRMRWLMESYLRRLSRKN